jgi:hypothetical protein
MRSFWKLFSANVEISNTMKGIDETVISLYNTFSAGDENVKYSEKYGTAFGRRRGEGAPKLP